ncbi:hypothetical protein [Stratiformator vulcanicus]|uniref:Uncharacterized protein n=1 Tax=Stratiformator vulcanicus TaxID=2527980 RepID=A0A517QXG2_9PLAN|nr:hypothetical protein [Stratiformator vulcanicus]QDT36345.1 hypothetical protein Pan189_07010 [Stratiformator vulcanicus]
MTTKLLKTDAGWVLPLDDELVAKAQLDGETVLDVELTYGELRVVPFRVGLTDTERNAAIEAINEQFGDTFARLA